MTIATQAAQKFTSADTEDAKLLAEFDRLTSAAQVDGNAAMAYNNWIVALSADRLHRLAVLVRARA